MTNVGKNIDIIRKHGPSLRGSSMRDFFDLLQEHNLYSEELHSKSLNEYWLNSNRVSFLSLDEPQKIRGRKRDLCFLNEGNELTYEDFFQLNVRTTERIIIDYNPSDEYHWIYDRVIPREDCDFFQTTYLDNPFLSSNLIEEIERLKDADDNYWRVYGLGERGQSSATIFTHWKTVDQIPDTYKFLNYGMDFGFANDPTAIVKVWTDGHGFAVEEICYSTGLTNADISKVLRDAGVARHDIVIADSAEPKSIQEIMNHGFNVHPCRKGRDSVRAGIQFMHSRPLMVTARSSNIIQELRNYKWVEDKNGRQLNQPVDAFDHTIDAMRYAITHNQTNPNYGSYVVG